MYISTYHACLDPVPCVYLCLRLAFLSSVRSTALTLGSPGPALLSAAFRYAVWTVNEGAGACELAELGANALITDRPTFIREQIITGDWEVATVGDEDLDVPLQGS